MEIYNQFDFKKLLTVFSPKNCFPTPLKKVDLKLQMVALLVFSLIMTGFVLKSCWKLAKRRKFSCSIDFPQSATNGIKTLPCADGYVKEGFFVDVLNAGGYILKGKKIIIPPAQKPIKFLRPKNQSFDEVLAQFKSDHQINDQKKIKFLFKDLTTEQAIQESQSLRIALNFANENHAGGRPGFHKGNKSGLFIYDQQSAQSQEEALCQRSDLMASLTQLPHTAKKDDPGSTCVQSYYHEKINSREVAYGNLNHLFAVQGNQGFYHSCYLDEPKPVVFITSAAKDYSAIKDLNCQTGSEAYCDAKQRIETHLLAAAFFSRNQFKEDENSGQPIELILGAFGCGSFAPKKKTDEYRQMIANIYLELLPKFDGIFDNVTFAVPTFGSKNPTHAAFNNHQNFKNCLQSIL